MSKKNKSTPKKAPAAPVNKLPKWGLLVAGLGAFMLVSVAMVIMPRLGIHNQLIRTVIVMALAVFAGIIARPLTLALQKRFDSFGE